jgi:hypothetical protein
VRSLPFTPCVDLHLDLALFEVRLMALVQRRPGEAKRAEQKEHATKQREAALS